MKTTLLLGLIALGWIGCENLHQTIRSASRPGAAVNDNPVLLVGRHVVTSEEDLKLYVRSLPSGAELSWDTTSLGASNIPLPQANLSVEDFGRYCQANGVAFRLLIPFEKTVVTRTYSLPPSSFQVFLAIINNPSLASDQTRPLFQECGVPFARGVTEFFQDAGVPFPPKSTVTYDPVGGRLSVTNLRENEEILSRMIWSHDTTEFDGKMRCLTERLKARGLVVPALPPAFRLSPTDIR